MRAGIGDVPRMEKGTAAVCRAPPGHVPFMLEKYISVRYNNKYETNKKGRTQETPISYVPMQEPLPPIHSIILCANTYFTREYPFNQ